MADDSLIRIVRRRFRKMYSDRTTWDAHWKELRDHVFPWAGNWVSDGENQNDGRKRADPVASVGREALMALSAGMQSGLTPRSERWFGLKLARVPGQEDTPDVRTREWLDDCTNLILDILGASNFYHSCAQIYEDLGLFGTSVVYVEPDFDTVVRFRHLSVGEYWLADDWRGRPDTLIRKFKVSVRNLIAEFGEDHVSKSVLSMKDSAPDHLVMVVHAVLPRKGGNIDSPNPKELPFASIYFEEGASDMDEPLRESGYKRFPFLCVRWSVHGEDVYGHSPAMYALADIKQAGVMIDDVMQMVEMVVHPPLQGPDGLDRESMTLDPDSVTIVPGMGRNGGRIEPIININANSPQLVQQAVQTVEDKVRKAFHYDVFMMFTGDESKSMTATEILERKQVRLTQLGPVLERMQTELYGPMIDLIWERCWDVGILPQPPENLDPGEEVKIEYRAALAKASDLSRVTNIQQYLSFIGSVAQVKPEVLELLDGDKLARITAEYLDVPPAILKPKKDVEAARQAQQQQAAQQQQLAASQAVADTSQKAAQAYGQFGEGSQKLSQVDAGDTNSAYVQLMSALMGGGAAQGGAA